MSENVGNVATAGQTGGKQGRKSNSKKLSHREFAALCIKAANEPNPLQFIMDGSGLTESSISARRSSLRKMGFPIPSLAVGRGPGEGGVKEVTDEDLAFLAQLTGKPIEQLKEESKQTIQEVEVRSQAVKAGRQKGQQTPSTETASA